MTIRHVVTWKLAAEDATERAAQAAEVARRLNALDGVVPQLLSISAGANIAGAVGSPTGTPRGKAARRSSPIRCGSSGAPAMSRAEVKLVTG